MSSQLTSSLRMIPLTFISVSYVKNGLYGKTGGGNLVQKKKGGGFDCSDSDKAGGLQEPRIPQGIQLHTTTWMTEMRRDG